MPKTFENVLYQDKYHLIMQNTIRNHPVVVARPKVMVIIHDVIQDELLLLQEEWLKGNYGFFLPEDILYQDVQENMEKTKDETWEDALNIAENICKMNGVIPKNLKLFSEEFQGRIHCMYYYFLVTDFQRIEVETIETRHWISIKEILEFIKEKAFYEKEEVGVLFAYFLQENKIMYNKVEDRKVSGKGDV